MSKRQDPPLDPCLKSCNFDSQRKSWPSRTLLGTLFALLGQMSGPKIVKVGDNPCHVGSAQAPSGPIDTHQFKTFESPSQSSFSSLSAAFQYSLISLHMTQLGMFQYDPPSNVASFQPNPKLITPTPQARAQLGQAQHVHRHLSPQPTSVPSYRRTCQQPPTGSSFRLVSPHITFPPALLPSLSLSPTTQHPGQ